MILVINESDEFAPYSEIYKIFEDDEKAIQHAKSIGYTSYELGINLRPGTINMYSCGNVKVKLMKIEVQK